MGAWIALGAALLAGGTAIGANASSKKANKLESYTDKWMPNIDAYTKKYFDDLNDYEDDATKLSDSLAKSQMSQALGLREQAMPGFNNAINASVPGAAALARGELPQGALDAFQRSGNAAGFGLGANMNFLMQGLYGAGGSVKAMSTGIGMLGALLGTMPQLNTPSAMSFLQQIMTPTQQTQTQLQIRGQNIGLMSAAAGVPSSGQMWGGGLQSIGSMAMIGGMMGGGAGGGGGGMFGGSGAGAAAPSGGSITSPGYVTPLG